MSDQNQAASNAAAPEVSPSQDNLESTENQENSQAEAAPESQQEAKKEEAKIAKKIKQIKYKLDGKEFDEELPFEIDEDPKVLEYIQKQLQLAKMAQKRAEETSDYKKKLNGVAEYIQGVTGNPKAFRQLAKELKVNEKELAQMIIDEEIANSQKTPEQIEREKLQAELEAMKQEREKEKKELEEREMVRLQEQYHQDLDNQMTTALGSTDLPKSPYVVKKIADMMLYALNKGQSLKVEDVVPLVREEIQNDIRDMFKAMPDEVVEQFLGQDNLKRLRKRNLAKAKETPASVTSTIKDTGASKAIPKEAKKTPMKDFFKNLEEKLK